MYKGEYSVKSSEFGWDTRECIPLALARMTDALQGAPRSLELKTHLKECQLLEKNANCCDGIIVTIGEK